jgi:type IV pilus assembly protein PilX
MKVQGSISPLRDKTQSVERGSSLIVVLIMLSVIFVIGVISSRLALFSERSARNDRDRQIALQSAEAALLDAELDIFGPNTAANRRVCDFDAKKSAAFVPSCGTGVKTGMCSSLNNGQNWRAMLPQYTAETGTAATNRTVQYGQFTGQTVAQGAGGLPARLPRYIIEVVDYNGTGEAGQRALTTEDKAFLVTAMGFGSRVETQVLLQTLLYKPGNKAGSGCS